MVVVSFFFSIVMLVFEGVLKGVFVFLRKASKTSKEDDVYPLFPSRPFIKMYVFFFNVQRPCFQRGVKKSAIAELF